MMPSTSLTLHPTTVCRRTPENAHVYADTLRPDRLVLGFETERPWAEAVLRQCCDNIIESGTPTIVTD